jgi:topoisomerase-4 subunit B
MAAKYNEDSIKSLDWHEHIRLRPGMYIGKLGDGQSPDDGIYVLAKEIIDNSIDEYVMGAGKKIEIEIEDRSVRIHDDEQYREVQFRLKFPFDLYDNVL